MKDFWNERYSEEGFAYGKQPNDFLKEHFQKIPNGGSVLCLSEGEGRNAVFLSGQGFKVTAVDISEVGMNKAKAWAKNENLEIQIVVADLKDYDFGNAKWDAIVSIFAHLPPELRKEIHSKVEKGLKPGGLLLLEAYRPEQLAKGTGGPSKIEMMMNLEILKKELPALAPLLQIETERDIHEGKYHNGPSRVVQFIGKRK